MKLKNEDCVALVIDVQQKLMPAMDRSVEALGRITVLIEGMKLLGVPVVVSEQYPQGLGPTLAEVADLLPGTVPWPKKSFSALRDPGILAALEASGRPTVIVCGVEAHVCVLQTVVDLVDRGFRAVVAADAVTSRQRADVDRALGRMTAEGALVTGVEGLLFELMGTAEHPNFKAISKLVK
jgi:nicotinamidase-related amidase